MEGHYLLTSQAERPDFEAVRQHRDGCSVHRKSTRAIAHNRHRIEPKFIPLVRMNPLLFGDNLQRPRDPVYAFRGGRYFKIPSTLSHTARKSPDLAKKASAPLSKAAALSCGNAVPENITTGISA